jgi:hypothetical protein
MYEITTRLLRRSAPRNESSARFLLGNRSTSMVQGGHPVRPNHWMNLARRSIFSRCAFLFILEPLPKLLEKRGNRHSGQTKPCIVAYTGRSATRNPSRRRRDSSNSGFRPLPRTRSEVRRNDGVSDFCKSLLTSMIS